MGQGSTSLQRPDNRMRADSTKRLSFLTLLFGVGDVRRQAFNWNTEDEGKGRIQDSELE